MMTTNNETNVTPMTWMQCCFAVCKAAQDNPVGNLPYAASYASAGRRMHDAEEQRVQALYILNNITHWRGDLAKRVRASLKEFAK